MGLLACSATDRATGACQSNADCVDDNPCTEGICGVGAQGCIFQYLDTPCDDGNFCTVDDYCVNGLCVAQAAMDCNDDNVCTSDSCDPQDGCIYTFHAQICDDGDACTQNDGCVEGECTGEALECDDNNTCTVDSCDPSTGCTIEPIESCCGNQEVEGDEVCDDGNQVDFDGCAADCLSDESCGNGLLDQGEQCDGDVFLDPCTFEPCQCSTNCTVKVESVSGSEGWESGAFDGASSDPPGDPHQDCTNPDTICIDVSTKELSSIWIANTESGTLARFDADTGTADLVVASYGEEPSRTAVVVDDGSVWVGNRGKDCPDDPACSNIVHLDKDGLFICRADVPEIVRAVAIDAENNVWAGSFNGRQMYKISGDSVDTEANPDACEILAIVDVTGKPYGATADSEGNVWIVNNDGWDHSFDPAVQSLEKIDIATNTLIGTYVPPEELHDCFQTYGISMDLEGRVLVSSMDCRGIFRFTPSTEIWEWHAIPEGTPRGLTVDENGNIFTALSHESFGSGWWTPAVLMSHIARVDPDMTTHSLLDMGSGIQRPVGIAFDKNGWLWTAGRSTNTAAQVDVANWDNEPTVNITTTFGDDPYTYSDFSGVQFLRFVKPVGSWTRIFDSGSTDLIWQSASWQGIEDGEVTDILVRVRSSTNLPGLEEKEWSEYATSNPADLTTLLANHHRYLEMEVRLTSSDPLASPVLSSVSVHWYDATTTEEP
ncbi:MAG: hypothetical protein CMH54_09700 [Myxococcales bacterium]|nr:hypothetical protein [Myxococcales bacterium]